MVVAATGAVAVAIPSVAVTGVVAAAVEAERVEKGATVAVQLVVAGDRPVIRIAASTPGVDQRTTSVPTTAFVRMSASA